MTGGDAHVDRLGRDGPRAILVVAPDPLGTRVAEELGGSLGAAVRITVAADVTSALASAAAQATPVALLVLSSDLGELDAAVARLDTPLHLRTARILIVTDRADHDDLAATIDSARLDAVITVPWTPGALAEHARSCLARRPRIRRGDDPTPAPAERTEGPSIARSGLLRDLELRPHEVRDRLLEAIERVLGPLPRLRVPAGTRLIHQATDVDAVFVVLSGSVALDRRSAGGELRLHHASTGPVIGLLSLTQQRQAFFTARATTEVETIHLSLDQLDRALLAEPEVGDALAAGAILALALRLRRAEQLQVEKIELNRELDDERQRLADALHQLEQARVDLVEQARFASLGELAAGVAHELNNPVAAMSRAVSFVVEDLERLLATHPDGELAREVLTTARHRPPLSTSEERARRRALEAALGDRVLAGRLHAVGIDDPDAARALLARGEGAVELTEAAAGLGGAVHNLELAAGRVSELVASLRAYARPDALPIDDVDVHASIEDAIRMTAHRLHGLEIERDYGDLPSIPGRPGQLGQVWTSLLVNAAEELRGKGRITIVTDMPDAEHVRVQVSDDGPGMDPAVVSRAFEPRFTTKHGTVRYGLGLGLAIVRRIVEQHGGRVALGSRPGRTVATVTLPARTSRSAPAAAGDRPEEG